MVRLLGIDFGTKKIGLALTNEAGTMAFPHDTIKNDDRVLHKVLALIQEQQIETVVVGESHDLKNKPNEVQESINTFIKQLRDEIKVPVVLESERFTTQAAMRIQGRNAQTDASAAALILDSYITRVQ